MLAPETLLNDRYRIVGLVGQGGMGAVYEAVDERLRAPVALKQTLVTGEAMARAFEREAQLLAGLRHPALPRVIDHFVAAEGQFLVMEFIGGQDLAAALRERGEPFPLPQVLAWADQLLDALDYLHGQSPPVIHRDIKPQNLKLAARGEVVLLDFGLAKGRAALPTRAATEGASLFGYTPQYAPLEQVQGAGTDARSDLYSLGATLYALVTGQPPADTLARATAVLNGRPDPLRPAHELSPAVPADLGGALAMAMALSADERFGSAAAMRNALRQSAAGAPAAAVGPTIVARQPLDAGPPPGDASPPRQGPPAPPATPRPPAGADGPGFATPERVAPARRPVPPPERRGPPLRTLLGLLIGLLAIGAGLWVAFGRSRGEVVQVDPTAMAPAVASPDAREQGGEPPPAGTPVALAEELVVLVGEIAAPGEHDAYSFEVEPGREIFVWTVRHDQGLAFVNVRLLDGGGEGLAERCLGCGQMGVQALRRGGAYTLVVGSDSDPGTGAYELRVNLVPPVATFQVEADVRVAGDQPAPGAATIGVPGAKKAFAFEAEPGEQIFVWTALWDQGLDMVNVALLDGNGDRLAERCLGCGQMGVQTLARGGSYSVVVGSDSDPGTGSFDLRLSPVPPPDEYAVGLPFRVGEGQPGAGAGTIAAPGAKQVFRFEAEAGQQIFVNTLGHDQGLDFVSVRLLDGNGDQLAERCLGCGQMGAQRLARGGSYSLVVGSDGDPATGAYALEVTVVP